MLQEGLAGDRVEDPPPKREKASAESTSAHFAAVVARRIAAGEDVGEAVLEAVERGGVITATWLRTCASSAGIGPWLAGSNSRCRRKSNRGELQLAQHLHGRLEVAAVIISSSRSGGQRLPFMMTEMKARARTPSTSSRGTARQLHRVPGHAVDASHPGHVDPGQHVVNAVAEPRGTG